MRETMRVTIDLKKWADRVAAALDLSFEQADGCRTMTGGDLMELAPTTPQSYSALRRVASFEVINREYEKAALRVQWSLGIISHAQYVAQLLENRRACNA
jgi:hypothetical protein